VFISTAKTIEVNSSKACPADMKIHSIKQKTDSLNFLKEVNISNVAPFLYTPEKFTLKEKKILLNFFTNVDKPVFAIFNLPQEVIGAMFSRYSRSSKNLRRLFLDEFYSTGEELAPTRKKSSDALKMAKERTAIFYKKVFAEFGDDSVIQMGSVHIAFEYVSQIHGAKAIEDQRVASAYIEKSTRYLDFSSKVNGSYLYMTPPELQKTNYKKDYQSWANKCFDLYSKYIPVMNEFLKGKYPLDKQNIEDSTTHKLIDIKKMTDDEKTIIETAYNRAVKAKAYDTVRFFLPLSTVTNLGAFFSGQAAELTINKMLISPFSEVRYLGKMAYEELMKVSPNFLQNINHLFGKVARDYRKEVGDKLIEIGNKYRLKNISSDRQVAKIVDFDKDADVKIASEILFTASKNSLSKSEIVKWCKDKKKKNKNALLKIILDSVPDRRQTGRSRRQKLPRAFEQTQIEVEFFTDIGAYKDLQRNRMSSCERQKINAESLHIPEEYKDPKLKELLRDYVRLARETKSLSSHISHLTSNTHLTEYIAVMGNKVRFTVRASLRQWVFFAELRTISGGHPSYRKALQIAAKEIIDKIPFTKNLFAHVDWIPDYGLGRLKAEVRTQQELSKLNK
jgi:thymidylate synthase ThyX